MYVRLEDTIRGFKEILEGKHDDLPEQAFYMVGTIEDAIAKAKKLARLMPLELTIVTPVGPGLSTATVESVVLPGSEGDFGVLPGHERVPDRAAHRAR